MNGHERNPRVQLARQINQVFRVVEQRLYQHAEQPDQYGHLYDQRPQTTDGAHPGFPIQPHGLLGNPRPIAGVTLLYLPNPRLQPRHRPHLPQLSHRERDRQDAHYHRKHDDGNSHLGKAHNVQHHEGIEHWANDYFVPKQSEYGQKFHYYLLCATIARTAYLYSDVFSIIGLVASGLFGSVEAPQYIYAGHHLNPTDGAIVRPDIHRIRRRRR